MKIEKILRSSVLLLCAVLMLAALGCSPRGMTDDKPVQPVERGARQDGAGLREVAANSRFSLSVDAEFGTVVLADRQTGRTYRSNPENAGEDPLAKGMARTNLRSQLLIQVADQKGNIDPYNSAADAVGENGFTVSRTENGVILDYHFKRLGIEVPLVITLSDDGLTARVLMNEVRETNEKYRLVSVGVLPYFGAAGPDDEGYVLLPDGSGALIRFNNRKTAFGYYNKPVYCNDAYESDRFGSKTGETLMMPLFGMHYDAPQGGKEAGFVTMVDEAAAMATLTSTPAGVNCSYTNAYFTFVYRAAEEVSVLSRTWAEKAFNMVSKHAAVSSSPTVSYRFLQSETTGYTDMARLVSARLKRSDTAETTAPSMVLDVYNSVVKLGYTLGIPHKKSAVVTDFAAVEAMLGDMKAHRVTLRLLGWNKGGAVGGSVCDSYAPAETAGGKEGLRSLLAAADKQGAEVYLEAEIARFTDSTWKYNALFHAATRITNKPIKVYTYRRSTNERDTTEDTFSLLSPQYLTEVMKDLTASLPDDGINLSLGSVSQYPYADFGKHFCSREQTADIVGAVLAQESESRSLYGENPAWYALPYMDVAADIPLFGSQYDFFDESVPFMQLVLRERMTVSTPSVNLSGEPQRVFLRAVETGCSLKFSFIGCAYEEIRDTRLDTLYGAEYAVWKDEALRYQKELETALDGLDAVSIREHRMLTDSVASVLYDNGTEILVNYGREDYTAGADTVGALSWLRRDTTGGVGA